MADRPKWDGVCPQCNSTKPLAKLFRGRDDIKVCMTCGAGYEEVEGEFVYKPTYSIYLNDAFRKQLEKTTEEGGSDGE